MPALRGSSQSLERGLAILSAFKPATPELGITDLARSLGLSRSTSHRYVSTLARLGYLDQNAETRKYRLGPRVLDLGFAAINSMELRQISAPDLQKLADETGHTVNMAISTGRTSSTSSAAGPPSLGSARSTSTCTSAHGSRRTARRWARSCSPTCRRAGKPRSWTRSSSSTAVRNAITTRPALVAELEQVRAIGVAVNNEELAYGLRSIAVPVWGQDGEAVAAINLAVHRSAASIGDLVDRLSPTMRRAAAGISALLGYRPA